MYTTTAEARDVRGNPVRSEPLTAQDKSQMNKHQPVWVNRYSPTI